MTDFPEFRQEDFSRFIAAEWPKHLHFNSGVHTVFDVDREHADRGATEVKFLFLDKAYSAGLRRWFWRCERGEKLPGCAEHSQYEKCSCSPVTVFMDLIEAGTPGNSFQMLMRSALKEGGTLSRANVNNVIRIHADFCELLAPRIRTPANSDEPANFQSFCSKYLWFHAGIFPVFDRFARIGLRRLQGRGAPYYEAYDQYADAILQLLRQVFRKESFSSEEIKQVDGFLVWIGADRSNLGMEA